MNINEAEKIIREHGGKIKPAINWTWALFDDDDEGQKCLSRIAGHGTIDHRGYHPARPDSQNPNLHKGGFRYRPM